MEEPMHEEGEDDDVIVVGELCRDDDDDVIDVRALCQDYNN